MNKKILSAKSSLVLIFIIFATHVDAQYFHLKNIEDKAGYGFSFPVLTGKTNAETLINIFLQGKELELLPGKQKHNLFENVQPQKDSFLGTSSISYKILVNTSKLLSIAVKGEYDGPSVNFWTEIFTFDSQTGKLIQFSDLFTKDGYKAIRKFVTTNRKRRLNNYIKALKTSGDNEKEYMQTYSDCLLREDKDNLDHDDLKFQKNGLHLTRKSCSGSHYFQVFEGDADIYDNQLSTKFLQPYLNEYGKCLLSTSIISCTRPRTTTLHEGVFRGKINQFYPITLLITYIQDDSFSAAYFYDKYGKKIELRGTFNKGSSLFLKEEPSDDDHNRQGFFKMRIQPNGSLTGSWSDGKNTYPVELK